MIFSLVVYVFIYGAKLMLGKGLVNESMSELRELVYELWDVGKTKKRKIKPGRLQV